MKILRERYQVLILEGLRAARIYFIPLAAAWHVLRHGGRYGACVLRMYRRSGML